MGTNVASLYWAARWLVRQSLVFAMLKSRVDDCYISLFRRLGCTWPRTILTIMLVPEAISTPDIFDATIQGVRFCNASEIYRMNSPRLLKTHADWRPAIGRAIYLVRDGQDAITSFYHYQVTRRQKYLTFNTFYTRYRQGAFGTQWHRNVESWLIGGKESLGENLIIVSFADLKADTVNVVTCILHFLGIEATEHVLGHAISEAGIERMRQIERSRRGDVGSSDVSFFRGGITGQWDHYFTPKIVKDFQQIETKAF